MNWTGLRGLVGVLVLTMLGSVAGCSSSRHSPTMAITESRSLRQAPPADLNLRSMIIPRGTAGRHVEFPMRPAYITIHSTQNKGATADNHGQALLNGRLRASSSHNRTGYLTWHFTVDDQEVVQSLPVNIQGEHADHDGPGNRMSIGIEICEFHDPARQAAAIARAARLAGWLRKRYGIPLSRVVPHYHWPQHHFEGHQKNCPAILLENGEPGEKWREFLRLVARS